MECTLGEPAAHAVRYQEWDKKTDKKKRRGNLILVAFFFALQYG